MLGSASRIAVCAASAAARRRLQRRHLVAQRDALGLQRHAVRAAALGLADLLGQGVAPRLLVLQHLQRAAPGGVLRQELLGDRRQPAPRHRRIEGRRIGADGSDIVHGDLVPKLRAGSGAGCRPRKSGEAPRLRSSSSRPVFFGAIQTAARIDSS